MSAMASGKAGLTTLFQNPLGLVFEPAFEVEGGLEWKGLRISSAEGSGSLTDSFGSYLW